MLINIPPNKPVYSETYQKYFDIVKEKLYTIHDNQYAEENLHEFSNKQCEALKLNALFLYMVIFRNRLAKEIVIDYDDINFVEIINFAKQCLKLDMTEIFDSVFELDLINILHDLQYEVEMRTFSQYKIS